MKLFITDYDDTLYTGDKEIRKTNKLLKKLQKNGYYVGIATGRSFPSIKNQINMHNIPYDFLCCADGSVIYDNNDNLIHYNYLNKEVVKPFEDYYHTINFEEIQYVYPECYSNILKEDDERLLGINICISTSIYTKELVDSFMKLASKYPKYSFLPYMHTNFSYLCVKPKGISKSAAITYLMKSNNINMKDVKVIGDSSNDIEMIREFNGACVLSSVPEVLKITKKKYKVIDDYIYELIKEE